MSEDSLPWIHLEIFEAAYLKSAPGMEGVRHSRGALGLGYWPEWLAAGIWLVPALVSRIPQATAAELAARYGYKRIPRGDCRTGHWFLRTIDGSRNVCSDCGMMEPA